MEKNLTEEQRYLKAKKKLKEIKGFYIHLTINIFSIILIVTVNLLFSPGYHWFWYAVFGIVVVQLIHGIVAFGFPKYGFNKEWEEKKIKELMNQDRY